MGGLNRRGMIRRALVVLVAGTTVPLAAEQRPQLARATPVAQADDSMTDSPTGTEGLIDRPDALVRAGQYDVATAKSTVKPDATDESTKIRSAATTAPPGSVGAEYVPNQYIVRVARGRAATNVAAELQGAGIDAEALSTEALRTVLVRTDPNQADQLGEVRKNPGVAQIWQDQKVSLDSTQTDPPWGLDRIDQATLPLDNAFSYDSDGTGVTAYVVDTGTRGTHTDFGGRVTSGWNGTGDPGGGNSDCHGHGTHVAGTVAGTKYGVAKKATIVPIRVLTCSGSGYTSTIVQGIDWAIAQHQDGTPAVMNMSLGGGVDSALDAAIASAVADGIVVVVAAGNSNADACTFSPARAPSAITVGATDQTDAKASFSNWGTCLDVWAPGVGILSDYRTGDTATTTMSGTSMASPHVAGAVARLLSANPLLTPSEVTAIITNNTVQAGDRNILQSPQYAGDTVPTAPSGLSATPSNGSATVTWTAPPDGVAAVELSFSTGGGAVVGRSVTKYSKYGLTNGDSTTVTVRFLNSRGYGPTSSTSVTPLDDGTPGQPSIRRIGSGNQWLNVEVNVPAASAGGAVSSLKVTASPSSGAPVVVTKNIANGISREIVKVDGLTNLEPYTLTVVATNGSGDSPPSAGVVASPSTAVNVSGKWSWNDMGRPSALRSSMVADETRGLLWAGALNRSIVAVDTTTRLVATGTLPSGIGMWMLQDPATGRVFAVPNQSGSKVYELSVSDSTVVTTEVVSGMPSVRMAILDAPTGEMIVAGQGVARYAVGPSGSLNPLSVPSLSLGSDEVNTVAVHGPNVVLGSNLGGWVKIWNRDSGTVVTTTGINAVGTLFAWSGGIIVSPTTDSIITKLDWSGAVVSTLDLVLRDFSGKTYQGQYYPEMFADIVPFDASNIGMRVGMSGFGSSLVSLNVDTMKVNAYGSASSGGMLTMGVSGPLLADNWLFDLDSRLRSRWKDFAPGSESFGTVLNSATGVVSAATFAGIYVETASGYGVRVAERAGQPLDPHVVSANGSARVTWLQPERLSDPVDKGNMDYYQLRPVTYDVVLQPGNIVRTWDAGPLDLAVTGLDPTVTYTAVVRARSPGGVTESEPITFTPSTNPSRPATPTDVSLVRKSEGCVTVSWTAVAGATSGYRVELRGRESTESVPAGMTKWEGCGFSTHPSILPLISVRITALGALADSIPSEWSDTVFPTTMPTVEGHMNSVLTSEALGVTAALSFSLAASESQGRRTALTIVSDTAKKTLPLPVNFAAIVGIDDFRREVLVANCSPIGGGIFGVSTDTLAMRELVMPATNDWEICTAAFDQARRAIWLAPSIYSTVDNYGTTGADVVAMSVDTPGKIVASSNFTCQPGSWTGEVYIASFARFTVDSGRTFVSCSSSRSGGAMEFFRVSDAATGEVIRTESTWVSPVGTTASGDAITITNDGVKVHSADPVSINFPAPLKHDLWGSMPLAESRGPITSPRDYQRSGNYVSAIPKFASGGMPYIVDLVSGTAKELSLYGLEGGGLLADGNSAVAMTRDSISISSPATTISFDAPAYTTNFNWTRRSGQQVTGYGYSLAPRIMQWAGPDRIVSLGRILVPDNFGYITDEVAYTAIWNLRPPAAPSITSRTNDMVSWTRPEPDGDLVDGSPTRWEKHVQTIHSVVRDAAGTIRCTANHATSCTSEGAFSGGATVELWSSTATGFTISTSPPATNGTVAPAPPALTAWPPSSAGKAAVRVGLSDAVATGWQVTCSRDGERLTATGTAPGLVEMSTPSGLWSCRARSFVNTRPGTWGPVVVTDSRTAAAAGPVLDHGIGTLSVTSGAKSFSCTNPAGGSVTGNAGESKAASAGLWACWLALADDSTVGVLAHSTSTPDPVGSPVLSRTGGRMILTFALPASPRTADVSATVECSGAVPASTTVTRTRVDIGPSSTGSTTCTVVRNYMRPGSAAVLSTSAVSVSTAPNNSPAFVSVASGTGTRGSTSTGYVASATDADSDPLSYSISGGPDSSLFQISAGVLTFKSGALPGTYSVIVAASDGAATVYQTVTIVVPEPTPQIPQTSPSTSTPQTTVPQTVTTVLPSPVVQTTLPPTTTIPTTAIKTSMTTSATRITYTSLAVRSGVSVPKGATVSAKASGASSKVCTVSGGAVRFKTNGTCTMTVTITTGSKKKVLSVTVRRKG